MEVGEWPVPLRSGTDRTGPGAAMQAYPARLIFLLYIKAPNTLLQRRREEKPIVELLRISS